MRPMVSVMMMRDDERRSKRPGIRGGGGQGGGGGGWFANVQVPSNRLVRVSIGPGGGALPSMNGIDGVGTSVFIRNVTDT